MGERRAYPNLFQAVLLLALEGIAGGAPVLFAARYLAVSNPYLVYAIVGAVVPICLGLVLWYGFRKAQTSLAALLPLNRAASVLGLFACVLGAQIILEDQRPTTPAALVGDFLQILTVTVYAPLFEELLYRGVILRGLAANYGTIPGLLLSSALFGAMHFYRGWDALFTVVVGLIAGFLYIETQSLVPPLVLHSLWNMLTRMVVNPFSWSIADVARNWSIEPEYRTLGLVLVIAGFFFLGSSWSANSRRRNSKNGPTRSTSSASATLAAEESVVFSVNRLINEARTCRGADADSAYARVYDACARLQEANPSNVSGLRSWGFALMCDAQRKPPLDAARLYAEAAEKFSAAVARKPDNPDLIAYLAWVTTLSAALQPTETAKGTLAKARGLFEEALRLKPASTFALELWAHVLYNQVQRGVGDDDIDTALAAADGKFQEAAEGWARAKGLEVILAGWGTIRFAQANRSTGEQERRLLREAKQMYAETLSRVPGGSTYNVACACARLGELDECQIWLEKGSEPGQLITREQMAVDPDLASVQDFDWFRRLLERPV